MGANVLRGALVALLLMGGVGPALAVQPDEVLADAGLEARARELSKGLRCVVCRNESIDESNADIARDLRLLVRERLVAGDSDAEVIDFVVARYGEYVLLNPRPTGSSLILWWAPVGMAVVGGIAAVIYLRRRRGEDQAVAPEALSEGERRRLAELMQDDT